MISSHHVTSMSAAAAAAAAAAPPPGGAGAGASSTSERGRLGGAYGSDVICRPVIASVVPSAQTGGVSYKRVSHFQSWLANIQGQECADVTDEILASIRAECVSEGLDFKRLNTKKMRMVLKRIGLSRLYENIPLIMYKLSEGSIVPPRFGQDLEHKLRTMFGMVQPVYPRVVQQVDPLRSNFCSYSYVLSKFLTILGHQDLTRHLPMLKSREKLWTHDQIFRKICEELGWEFTPSL